MSSNDIEFSKEDKEQIITKLTDAMVDIEGETMRSVTWVKIEEVPEGQWGVGGTPLNATMVHKLQSEGCL